MEEVRPHAARRPAFASHPVRGVAIWSAAALCRFGEGPEAGVRSCPEYALTTAPSPLLRAPASGPPGATDELVKRATNKAKSLQSARTVAIPHLLSAEPGSALVCRRKALSGQCLRPPVKYPPGDVPHQSSNSLKVVPLWSPEPACAGKTPGIAAGRFP